MNDPEQNLTEYKSLDSSMLKTLKEQIQYLAERNSGIKNLNYFYEVYKEIYGNRVKELANHKKNGKKIVGVICNFVPIGAVLNNAI